MNKLESVCEVPAGCVAVLSQTGECWLFSVQKEYSRRHKRNVLITDIVVLTGIRNLAIPEDDPLLRCGGVMFQNGHYVLAHALDSPADNQSSMRHLLSLARDVALPDENLSKVHLCTTNPEPGYRQAIIDIFGSHVKIVYHRKYSGRAGILPQRAAIGEDIFYCGCDRKCKI